MNIVEALGFMELFRDFLGCHTILDELFSAARLEFQCPHLSSLVELPSLHP